MTLGLAFWVIMIVWLVFGLLVHFGMVGGIYAGGSTLLLFVLFLLLGWQVFGPPLRCGTARGRWPWRSPSCLRWWRSGSMSEVSGTVADGGVSWNWTKSCRDQTKSLNGLPICGCRSTPRPQAKTTRAPVRSLPAD